MTSTPAARARVRRSRQLGGSGVERPDVEQESFAVEEVDGGV
jgi:hypothetical protein